MSRSIVPVLVAAVAVGCSSPAGSSGETPAAYTEQALSRAPRIWLTSDVLARLQKRAAAGDTTWAALRAHCDALTGATFNPPSGTAYPNAPDVGQGYEGDGYLPEVLALGLCYTTASATDPASAAKYGAAGDRLLATVSTPAASGGQDPSTDDGYGIRNYGVAMAVGYDWLYPALSSATRAQVIATVDAWIGWYDKSGFINSQPIGNYFVGYLLAKATAAIGLEGDDSNAAAYWSDVQTRMWSQLMDPSYVKSMTGGGWPEGWQYGPLSVTEVGEFLWAVKSGKGLDWWGQLPQAHDQAAYIAHFAWPSRMHMDDQGTVHAQAALRPPSCAALALAGMLAWNGDPYAPTARSLANDLLASTGDQCDLWQSFLHGDPTAPATPSYTQATLSYFADGPGHVAARSSWQKDAVWASFVSGPYIDAPDSGEQYFNQGAVAMVQGDQPILVNATGWLPQAATDNGESFVYDDTWGSATRLLNNTFYATGTKQIGADPTQSTTHMEHYEDLSAVVHARGRQLEQQYSGGVITQWTRDYAYVRPGTVVVYDRTTVPSGCDQWLAWHTPTQPAAVTTSDTTQKRYDVPAIGSSAIAGSIRTLLPSSPSTTTTSLVNGAAWRLEEHASGASQTWLTTITAGAQVPDQVRLSAADGNVTAGNVVGVHLGGSREQVVLFSSDHTASASVDGASYVVAQSGPATHVLFDLAACPNGYGVKAVASSGKLAITVAPGGAGTPSAEGTLVFDVAPDGTVTFPSTGGGGSSSSSGAGGSSGGVGSSSGAGGSSGGSSGASSSGGSGGAGDVDGGAGVTAWGGMPGAASSSAGATGGVTGDSFGGGSSAGCAVSGHGAESTRAASVGFALLALGWLTRERRRRSRAAE